MRAAALLVSGLFVTVIALPHAASAAEPAAVPAPPSGEAAPAGEAPAAGAAEDPAAAARVPVERLYATLDDVMARADALGFEGRYEALAPVVASSYDVNFMAQLILGSGWKELTPQQQARWVDAFTRFTVSTYADRFDGARIRFEIGASEPAAQETTLVRTVLHPKDAEPVKLDYRVRPGAGGYRIVDVYLNGTVSELALRRSEYSSLMKREGFDALVGALEQKSAAAKAGTAEEAGAP
jgi:phospholipid transport system substrate-binding protein